ncbi:hypothetical protein BOTBODRAFT_365381 [Botryobasidium botryosum FD-172 SS1]|uniref:Uncharacterized protein n=1 Tax=Botryobasidium botryosum (strain FD-172 SS1) TaxID=930990 RepID=A0A067MG45_BOTB1|nr:hypothetical protein BOTBODRAFT_365381 [Botryobasidium botryosum FD-172 SS1]
MPNVLVTIDYSKVGISGNQEMAIFGSASVWIGLTNSISDIYHTTTPITILPSSHRIGSFTMSARRMFAADTGSTFGVFQRYRTFGVIDTTIHGDNPYYSTPRGNNVSSLQLFQQFDPSALRIVQDTTINSVLNGLSDLGGLYTAMNGIVFYMFQWSLAELLGVQDFALVSVTLLIISLSRLSSSSSSRRTTLSCDEDVEANGGAVQTKGHALSAEPCST